MKLFIFDIVVSVFCLTWGVLSFMIAREFGLFRSESYGNEFSIRLRNMFAAYAWAGFITFIGGALKGIFIEIGLTGPYHDWRILIVRALAILPVFITTMRFYQFIVKSQKTAFIAKKPRRANGKEI